MEYDERDTDPAPWDPYIAYEELSAKLSALAAVTIETNALIRAGFKDIGDLKESRDNLEQRVSDVEDEVRELRKSLRPPTSNGASFEG